MYSSTLPLTLALDGVGGQRHAQAALPPGKIRYPLYRTLSGAQGRSTTLSKFITFSFTTRSDRSKHRYRTHNIPNLNLGP
jgi:hypothetical protein